MGIINVRVDPETQAAVERLAQQTGRTKSEILREAIQNYCNQRDVLEAIRPAALLADLIGSCDSGGLQLSERTGERFERLLKADGAQRASHRRGPPRRAS